jgi:hypothetical protein
MHRKLHEFFAQYRRLRISAGLLMQLKGRFKYHRNLAR